jgi:hypothetical protein
VSNVHHLGFHAREVSACARECLLDLVYKHHDPWWIATAEHRAQEAFSISHPPISWKVSPPRQTLRPGVCAITCRSAFPQLIERQAGLCSIDIGEDLVQAGKAAADPITASTARCKSCGCGSADCRGQKHLATTPPSSALRGNG